MSIAQDKRGGAPVGFITELDGIEAACVIYLRLWCDGPEAKATVWNDFASSLGADRGRRAMKSFEDLCSLCTTHSRRPLMRHSLNCKCLGADESCFANFIACAATGEREDAMLIATLLVRPDVAPLITALATDFGHAFAWPSMLFSSIMSQGTASNAASSLEKRPVIAAISSSFEVGMAIAKEYLKQLGNKASALVGLASKLTVVAGRSLAIAGARVSGGP